MPLDDKKLEQAVVLLRRELADLRLLYLFGSQARDQVHRASDYDLAVLCSDGVAGEKRWEVQASLATILGSEVDLVDLRQASTVLRAQVMESGRLLYEADVNERARFELYALSSYARLNEERGEILADAKARGTVYG